MKIPFKGSTIESLTINQFNRGVIDTGPLTETITIPCSKGFKELIDYMVRLTGQNIDTLGHKWILKGMIKDIDSIFSLEPYSDKSLSKILDRKAPRHKDRKTQGLRRKE